jgi:hypothetical protein
MQFKVACITLALLTAGCATQPDYRTAQAPEALKPAAGEKLVSIVPAQGDQIYECREVKDKPGTYDWAFVAPEAVLYDVSGRKIGKHYAGPHWEADDGSKVVGSVKSRADAVSASDIPLLLLDTKSVGKSGTFDRVTSIQRLSTHGGVAPKGGCPVAGYRVRIPYTADYYLFAK